MRLTRCWRVESGSGSKVRVHQAPVSWEPGAFLAALVAPHTLNWVGQSLATLVAPLSEPVTGVASIEAFQLPTNTLYTLSSFTVAWYTLSYYNVLLYIVVLHRPITSSAWSIQLYCSLCVTQLSISRYPTWWTVITHCKCYYWANVIRYQFGNLGIVNWVKYTYWWIVWIVWVRLMCYISL